MEFDGSYVNMNRVGKVEFTDKNKVIKTSETGKPAYLITLIDNEGAKYQEVIEEETEYLARRKEIESQLMGEEIRYRLDDTDFYHLINGGQLKIGDTTICLADIGYHAMTDLISRSQMKKEPDYSIKTVSL